VSFRLAVVNSHPIQYYAPIYRELARRTGLDAKVFYCCDWAVKPTLDPGFGQVFSWDVPLLDGYEYEFLPIERRPTAMTFRQVDNPAIGSRLDAFRPHAVWIHGYGFRSNWRALRWARRAAVLYTSDSELLHPRSLKSRLFKALPVRYFFNRCDRFITIGDNNEAYYRHYGVPAEKLIRGALPIDLSRFRQTLADPDRPSREQVRARWGLPSDAIVVAFAAKMIDIKRPADLIDAIARLRIRGVPIYGLMIGDGPLRPALEQRVHDNGLGDLVRFTGFVNQREIPLVLECADILAMCSDVEPHGQAVAESMAVGSAIVASDRVGCVGPNDSARPGANAVIFPAGNVEALAAVLERLVTDRAELARMKSESWRLAETQDIPVMIQAILRSLQSLAPEFATTWAAAGGEPLSGLRVACGGSDPASSDASFPADSGAVAKAVGELA
jgi:glycosyltransferase involved in cell wall biosynthesis